MKKINLFCGNNSVGLPFGRDNKEQIGYYDLIKDYFIKHGYEVGGCNISSLTKNRTWNFTEIFEKNYTLSQIKNIQIKSVDHLRKSNFLFKIIIPKKWKKDFEISEYDKKTIFKDEYVKNKNTVFLYSAGPNDFFTYINSGPVELISSKVRKKVPENLEELALKCIDNMEGNLKLLMDLNKNVEIYVLGFYYSPLYDKLQRLIYLQEKIKKFDHKYINYYRNIIEFYNLKLEEMCLKYKKIKFVDIAFVQNYCNPLDFHPNLKGNQLIANEIIKKLK